MCNEYTKEEVVGLSLGKGLPHLGGVGLPAALREHLGTTPRAVWVPVKFLLKPCLPLHNVLYLILKAILRFATLFYTSILLLAPTGASVFILVL